MRCESLIHARLAGALTLLVALCLLTAPTVAHADLEASVVGGELRLIDDPGGSPDIDLVYEPDYFPVPPFVGGPAYKISRFAQIGGVRAGAGCGFSGTNVLCPAAGVTTLVGTFGDGNDSFATDVNVFPPRPPLPFTRVVLDLGAGTDRLPTLNLAGPAAVEVDGGPDSDSILIPKGMQSVTLRGGDGGDGLGAGAPSGAALLDGGAGNDEIFGTAGAGGLTLLGGDGNDELGGSGRRTTIDAGAGDDLLGVKRDGDADTLVCGAGKDLFSDDPSTGDVFGTDCPPLVEVAKRGKLFLGGRVPVATQAITFTHPVSVSLRLARILPGPDQVLGRLKTVRAPAGTSAFALRLTKAAIRRFKDLKPERLRVIAYTTGRGGDVVPYRSNVGGGIPGPFFPIAKTAGPAPGVCPGRARCGG